MAHDLDSCKFIDVTTKAGPLLDQMIIGEDVLGSLVRQTCLNIDKLLRKYMNLRSSSVELFKRRKQMIARILEKRCVRGPMEFYSKIFDEWMKGMKRNELIELCDS